MYKIKSEQIEIISLFLIVLSFISISLFLPIYDTINGFHNLILDKYQLIWYDGKSPANFYLVKNIIERNSISFPKGYLFDNIQVENLIDFFEVDGRFYPQFNPISNYLYATILYSFSLTTDIQLFKGMLILNIIFSALILLIFYHVQRILGLNNVYSLISTFMAGIATSILIYSRYLFIDHQIMSLTFILLIYFILKNKKKTSTKINIFITLLFSFYLVLLSYIYLVLLFFIVLSYFFIKYKPIQFKFLIITILISCLFSIYLQFFYPKLSTTYKFRDIPNGIKNYVKIANLNIFTVFSKYVNALDYSIFGYHDVTSVWKLYRTFAYIYTFEELKGNALFLSSNGLFASLFGPRGIVYNSPYLIFSILGIFFYKRKKEKNLLLVIIILIILTYGLFNLRWQGGLSPRYIRYYTMPILFLTFFSFYYIQQTKNILVKIIFLVLIILSILNITSLSVRADWTYEHEADLVSYDLVLWPWYPPKPQENIINLYLTEQGESVEWKFGGEAGCKAYGSLEGIITDVCNCEYATYAERTINIPWGKIRANITACGRNGDGVTGKFYFGKIEKEIFIPSDLCVKESILIENSTGEHSIILKSKKYGECIGETVIWKLITIEEI